METVLTRLSTDVSEILSLLHREKEGSTTAGSRNDSRLTTPQTNVLREEVQRQMKRSKKDTPMCLTGCSG